MIAARLKQETQEAHYALEALMVPAMKQVDNNGDYAQLLYLFYGFYQPLETRLAAFAAGYFPDFEQRRKSALLIDDLQAIGQATDNIPLAQELPQINNLAQALGAMYVLEGSTLGGTLIAKMLGQQLQSDTGLQFFKGYGPVTGSMWKAFIAQLDAYPATDTELAQLIQAANDTFNTLKHWTALHYGASSFATEKL